MIVHKMTGLKKLINFVGFADFAHLETVGARLY